jgi:ribosomal-protein-alanine N-acetyltransferase
MAKEDIDKVNEIDREAFPSQWPPANYRQELQNKIAHYLVACDDAKTIETPAVSSHRSKLAEWLMPWTRRQPRSQDTPPPPVIRKYIVGFSGLWMMADEAHVTNLAVRRQYQGKGLGELLLIASIDLAADLKASFMTLEVRASNLVAQSLYNKYGFIQMGIRRGYYLDNHEDAIIMSTDSIGSESFQARVRQLREALAKKLTG